MHELLRVEADEHLWQGICKFCCYLCYWRSWVSEVLLFTRKLWTLFLTSWNSLRSLIFPIASSCRTPTLEGQCLFTRSLMDWRLREPPSLKVKRLIACGEKSACPECVYAAKHDREMPQWCDYEEFWKMDEVRSFAFWHNLWIYDHKFLHSILSNLVIKVTNI